MPRETTPGRWTPAGAFAVPPVPDVRVPSDDDGDGGGDDGGTADDPAEAANRDPLRQRRPQRRPVTVRRPAPAAERLVPSSGDRPGCHLIRDFFEADRPYLSLPVRHRCRPLPPRLRPRRSTISRFCANPSRRPVTPTAGNTWVNENNNYFKSFVIESADEEIRRVILEQSRFFAQGRLHSGKKSNDPSKIENTVLDESDD